MKAKIMKDMQLSFAPFTKEQKKIYKDFNGKFGSVWFGFAQDGRSYCITDDGVLEIKRNEQ